MPIKFRCTHCRQFLGISPSKAGELTDCPMCGRTIRVPGLDGKVAPLPPARLDLRDAQLAEALTALAHLGSPTSAAQPPDQANGSMPVAVPVTREATSTAPAPVPVPVPLDPPLPAERVTASAVEIPMRPAVEPDVLLRIDLGTETALAPRERRRRRRDALPRAVAIGAIAAGLFLAGFVTGWLTARGNTRGTGLSAQRVAASQGIGGGKASETSPAPVAGVRGSVTYTAADGRTRPDGGARVLALPAERPSAPPLSVAGFRAGAVPADRERAIAEIRALGGDYVVADPQGGYLLHPAAGDCELLFLSRHQPRDETQPLEPRVDELLTAFFDQPSGLVGSVDIRHATLNYDGGSVQLDQQFKR